MLIEITVTHFSQGHQQNRYHINGFVQDCSNSIADTLELLQSCIDIYHVLFFFTFNTSYIKHRISDFIYTS